MRFCLLMTALGTAAVTGRAGGPAEAPRTVTAVVRADLASGRLVRAVVVRRSPAESAPATLKAAGMVEEAARMHRIDPLLVHSMIEIESGYNPFAVSPKGAGGLMQLLPRTARRFGVRNRFNLRENIEGGVRYFRYLLDRFGDERLAIAAYNAGEDAVRRYGGIPPYPETRDYVAQVGSRYRAARRAAGRQISTAPEQEARASVREFVDAQGRVHVSNQ